MIDDRISVDDQRIGCISLCPVGDRFYAIDCNKGRGIILPGGKWERGPGGTTESYKDAAKRELLEETGIVASAMHYIFGAPNYDPIGGGWFYIMAFVAEYQAIIGVLDRDFGSGRVVLASEWQLCSGYFKNYYELMFDAYRNLAWE